MPLTLSHPLRAYFRTIDEFIVLSHVRRRAACRNSDHPRELIRDNIRVNTINPGLVLTPDWIKTAKELTQDAGGDCEGHLHWGG